MVRCFVPVTDKRWLDFLSKLDDIDEVNFWRPTPTAVRQPVGIRAALAAAGTPIGPYDILTTGEAMARELILITRNASEFAREDGLCVQTWEDDAEQLRR